MPYIDPFRREIADDFGPNTAGELNYVITERITAYLDRLPGRQRAQQLHAFGRYADFNEVIGVLECCKLELYRRMVAPYEDLKCAENGDVYPKGVA